MKKAHTFIRYKNSSECKTIDHAKCSIDGRILFEYLQKEDKTIIIQEGIEHLSYNCINDSLANQLILPKSLKSIEHGAINCDYLETIYIPENVDLIEDGFFSSTASGGVKSILVAANNPYYTSIDGVLFDKKAETLIAYPPSKQDTHYNIPEGVRTIGSHAFYHCSNLNEITIPDSVRTIEDWAFTGTNIGIIDIPRYVYHISDSAFAYCKFLFLIFVDINNSWYSADNGVLFDKIAESIVKYPQANSAERYIIPKWVKTVGDYAFSGAFTKMVAFETDDDITIGHCAFECSKIQIIHIPYCRIKFKEGAFRACENINLVFMPNTNGKHYFSEHGRITYPNNLLSKNANVVRAYTSEDPPDDYEVMLFAKVNGVHYEPRFMYRK